MRFGGIILSIYNKTFYDNQEKGSLNSAKIIVPIVMDIVKPKSVIDVGCGVGTWLSVFKQLGVNDILGLDGEWVDQNRLMIPKSKFKAIDLENPVKINQKFDLAVSLEVAEHISNQHSENFIKYLTDKAPLVLFSAAIPFQGGTNHINEQWQEYWVNIFKKNDYKVIDCIRPQIWEEKTIEWWYTQNILLFIENNYFENNFELKKNLDIKFTTNMYSIVHPRLYLKQIKDHENSKKVTSNNYSSQLESQRRFFEEKIGVLENEKVEFFNESKNLFSELKSQKEVYDGQLESQRRFFEEKIKVLETEKNDYFKRLKIKESIINELMSSNSWKLTEPFRKLGKWVKRTKYM